MPKLAASPFQLTTKLDDKSLSDLGPWTYEVRAVNSAGNSAWTLTTNPISPIGGPNVAGHLLAIAADFKKWVDWLPPSEREFYSSEFITDPGQWLLAVATNDPNLGNQISDWDIFQLANSTASSPSNDGVLPGGTLPGGTPIQATATADGAVYQQVAVNYWLLGAMASAFGWPVKELVSFYASAKSQTVFAQDPTVLQQLAWIVAGDSDNVDIPSQPIPNWYEDRELDDQSMPAANIAGVRGAPATDVTGPLNYQVGISPQLYIHKGQG